MNNINKISLAVFALCSIANFSAFAQAADVQPATSTDSVITQAMDYNPSWYITPSLNMMRPDSEFGVNDHGEGAGLSIGKPVSEDWDIQIGTKYGRQRANGLKYQQNTLGVDALYMLSRSSIRPFIFVGAGYQQDRLNNNTGEVHAYAPFLEAGLGVQAVLSDQWALQLDFRREHGYLKDNTFGSNSNGNNYLSLGVSYSFDKSPTVAVAKASPPPAPAPAPVYVAPVAAPVVAPAPKFEKVVLTSTELFGFDKFNLQMPQPKLDDIATALNNNPQVNHVVISGYTDRIGSDKYNNALSLKRANAVKDYLISKNISADRLFAEGKGKSNPIVTCTEKKLQPLIVCLEPNRRVEVEQITIEQRVN
ncbi:OOP family OmpA-OmpF porin [Oxalobacteraceae bacterium GrIS 2.11]